MSQNLSLNQLIYIYKYMKHYTKGTLYKYITTSRSALLLQLSCGWVYQFSRFEETAELSQDSSWPTPCNTRPSVVARLRDITHHTKDPQANRLPAVSMLCFYKQHSQWLTVYFWGKKTTNKQQIVKVWLLISYSMKEIWNYSTEIN